MKSNTRRSLFSLLAKNYLAFTLALLFIAGGVYLLWNGVYNHMFRSNDVDGLMRSAAFLAGRYQDISPAQYLGNDGAFAVLRSDGSLVYVSDPDFDVDLTAGELSCIQVYQRPEQTQVFRYQTETGDLRYLVTRTRLSNGESMSQIMVLDGQYRVLSGALEEGRISYTQREFEFLTGQYGSSYLLYRTTFVTGDVPYVLLLRLGTYDYEYYTWATRAAGRLWFLVIPLYVLATGIFIYWLNSRIRRPLDKLDGAILALGEGKPARASDCGGPREIQRLGENFDAMAAKLAESEEERRRLDESRQKIIADISHDLKTPITVISGYTSAIHDGKVPPEELPRYLDVIHSKANALADLISTLYEYSKTQHPDFRLNRVDTDICEFLRKYLAEKYEELDLAGFSLDVNIPEDPIYCRLDPFQFRRVLDNIFSNSLRHNALGTLLYVELGREENRVVIRLADDGSGIPAAIRDRLFEPFTVGSESRSGGGTGLGLAITRRIVEAHGGMVRLVTPPSRGRGTEFEIILPLS